MIQRTWSGERLRALRRQRGLSREVLAFAIGRSYASLTNYERGVNVPPATVVAALAAHLDCTTDDLFDAKEVVDA